MSFEWLLYVAEELFKRLLQVEENTFWWLSWFGVKVLGWLLKADVKVLREVSSALTSEAGLEKPSETATPLAVPCLSVEASLLEVELLTKLLLPSPPLALPMAVSGVLVGGFI